MRHTIRHPAPIAILLGLAFTAFTAFAQGCGSSLPPPSERLITAESASRSARELGADREPNAALHLKLAQEQIDLAKKLMADGDNNRADLVLQRAGSDAELAVMLAKESSASGEAQKAKDKVNAVKNAK